VGVQVNDKDRTGHGYLRDISGRYRKEENSGKIPFLLSEDSWSVIWRDVTLSKKYKPVRMKIADYGYRYRYR